MKKGKIILRDNYAGIDFSMYDDSFLIVKHDTIKFDIPNSILFSEYKILYPEYHNYNKIVIVGANRAINPSNRCDFINDYLSIMTRDKYKICISDTPFISEAWRCFWIFQICNLDESVFKVNYSYPIERSYNKYIFENKSCEYFLENKNFMLFNEIDTNLNVKKSKIKYYSVDISFYEEIKKDLYFKHNTIKSYLNELLDILNKKYQVQYDFNCLGVNMYLPDLKIYRLIQKENERQEIIYNKFAK